MRRGIKCKNLSSGTVCATGRILWTNRSTKIQKNDLCFITILVIATKIESDVFEAHWLSLCATIIFIGCSWFMWFELIIWRVRWVKIQFIPDPDQSPNWLKWKTFNIARSWTRCHQTANSIATVRMLHYLPCIKSIYAKTTWIIFSLILTRQIHIWNYICFRRDDFIAKRKSTKRRKIQNLTRCFPSMYHTICSLLECCK